MSETLIIILSVILVAIGIIGSIIPGLPGPPFAWGGMLLTYLWGGARCDISSTELIVMGVVMIIVCILDYVLPVKLTKNTGGSEFAGKGAMVGLILGCLFGGVIPFLSFLSIIIGPFLGAYIYERYWGDKNHNEALKAAKGALWGLLAGTGLKIAFAFVCLIYII